MKRSFKVYKITCKVNNKIYIGQTIESLTQRFNRHMGYQKDEHDTKFYRAIRKYGKDNFYIELLEEVSNQNELDKLIEYIKKTDLPKTAQKQIDWFISLGAAMDIKINDKNFNVEEYILNNV